MDPNQGPRHGWMLTVSLMNSSPAGLDAGALLLACLAEAVGLATSVFDSQVGARMRDCRRFLPAQLDVLLAAVTGALDASTTAVRR